MLILFRMGLFGSTHGWWEVQKGSAPYNPSHISYNDETWHRYTLPKKAPKNI